MKIFKFTPYCFLSKTEKWLEGMELKGWRLDRIGVFCLYTFKKCNPKSVKYFVRKIFTNKEPSDRTIDTIENGLIQKFNATNIKTSNFVDVTVQRIVIKDGFDENHYNELHELKEYCTRRWIVFMFLMWSIFTSLVTILAINTDIITVLFFSPIVVFNIVFLFELIYTLMKRT